MSMDYYEQELEDDLPELDESWVKDLTRLDELKAQKTQIESEIAHINEIAALENLVGTFIDSDGTARKVSIRQDPLPPKVDLAKLAEMDASLYSEVTSLTLDSTKLKEAIKRGYFTGTSSAALLITGLKKPWIQITNLAKEENASE